MGLVLLLALEWGQDLVLEVVLELVLKSEFLVSVQVEVSERGCFVDFLVSIFLME
jgi:hypothetical protein